MKRRICSYDMATVPDPAYVLKDAGGEMYLCGARCLALWSLQHVTHPHAMPEQVNAERTMTSPDGKKRHFADLQELTKWAAANLLSPGIGEWSALGVAENANSSSPEQA